MYETHCTACYIPTVLVRNLFLNVCGETPWQDTEHQQRNFPYQDICSLLQFMSHTTTWYTFLSTPNNAVLKLFG
jgi:hypothetical protein